MASLIDNAGACWPPRGLRSLPAADAVLAGRPLLCLSVVSAFPPNRLRTRSAISSSLSWSPSFVRSASSRAIRSEIRCFSCAISSNVAIYSLPPRPPNTGITRPRRLFSDKWRISAGRGRLLIWDMFIRYASDPRAKLWPSRLCTTLVGFFSIWETPSSARRQRYYRIDLTMENRTNVGPERRRWGPITERIFIRESAVADFWVGSRFGAETQNDG